MSDKQYPEKRYLGDSVYALFDGYHVILTTENGLPDDPSNKIALEPDVIDELNGYVSYVQKFYEKPAVPNAPATPEETQK